MSVLGREATDLLRMWGISRKDWIAEYGYQGKWFGDRCGCPDDRCIGYHHEAGQECGCLESLTDQLACKRRGHNLNGWAGRCLCGELERTA